MFEHQCHAGASGCQQGQSLIMGDVTNDMIIHLDHSIANKDVPKIKMNVIKKDYFQSTWLSRSHW